MKAYRSLGSSCSFPQQPSIIEACSTLQAQRQQSESHAAQLSQQQGFSQVPLLKQQQPLPTTSLPPTASAAVQNLPPHVARQPAQPLHNSSVSITHSNPQQAQQPGAGPASGGLLPQVAQPHLATPPAWQGQLAKSGLLKCKAECLSSDTSDGPLSWPAVLDVRARVVVNHALELPKQHAPQHLVIRCIVSTSEPKNEQEFHEFCQYLTEKQRAGVVNLGSKASKHDLFLVPGASGVYQQLHMQDPKRECLVAITTCKL